MHEDWWLPSCEHECSARLAISLASRREWVCVLRGPGDISDTFHSYNNCQLGNGAFNTTLCPDAATCAQNCAVEGVDYSGYGISVSGSAITLKLFLQNGNTTTLASPRAYLLANETQYDVFKLLNQEITYDVDVSQVPCGINGALYLSEMLSDGGYNAKTNPAGAQYGTGYCDAQCPKTPFGRCHDPSIHF